MDGDFVRLRALWAVPDGVLDLGAKAVADQIHALDRGDGCWASAAALGARIGLSERQVRRHRTHLLHLGLVTVDRTRRRVGTWRLTIPLPAVPAQPTWPELQALAATLTDAIRSSTSGCLSGHQRPDSPVSGHPRPDISGHPCPRTDSISGHPGSSIRSPVTAKELEEQQQGRPLGGEEAGMECSDRGTEAGPPAAWYARKAALRPTGSPQPQILA